MDNPIFVFGSNLAGRHGKGAAKYAYDNYGAEYGVGVGPTGLAYALPTKDERLRPLTLEQIDAHFKDFVEYARSSAEFGTYFELTPFGTGLGGKSIGEIKQLIKSHVLPFNVLLSQSWLDK